MTPAACIPMPHTRRGAGRAGARGDRARYESGDGCEQCEATGEWRYARRGRGHAGRHLGRTLSLWTACMTTTRYGRNAQSSRLLRPHHSPSMGWDSRSSVSNYVFNHVGQLCRGRGKLLQGTGPRGVTRRFPELNFAFLEGGVAWACELYAGLVGHCAKRNRTDIRNYDPAEVDQDLLERLADQYGNRSVSISGARTGGWSR